VPTNLPAEAKHKWSEASSARTPKEKLRALQEFLSLVPKHKGTSRLRAQVKRQMAVLRREIEEKGRKKIGKEGPRFFIEKEGAAQIVILGLTNVGRSSLLSWITNAKVEVSDYPFTTHEPVPGMFQYEDLQFQIVEAPALMRGSRSDEVQNLQTLGLARNADCLILMVDLSDYPCEQLSFILDALENSRILVEKPQARVDVERKHAGSGIRIFLMGRLIDCTFKDLEGLLRSYRIFDAVVKVYGNTTLDDVENAIFESVVYRPAIVVANKVDVPSATDRLKELEEFVGDRLAMVSVSCKNQVGLKELGMRIFEALDIIRVYTKEPSDLRPSPKPFVLKRGTTVLDLAKKIHTELFERFAYARVWSERLTFSPQRVGASFVLEDRDVVEIRAKK